MTYIIFDLLISFFLKQEVPFYLDDFLIPDSTDVLQDLYVIGLQESTSQR